MKREIIIPADGSSTIHLPEWNEHYHSKHGAIQEAAHVFIQSGLHHCCQLKSERAGHLAILEMGFGTGLNALMTLFEAEKLNIRVDYVGIEAYPVTLDEVFQLNYADRTDPSSGAAVFKTLHELSWEHAHRVTSHFSLTKRKQFFNAVADENTFDLIYFDAFGPRVQPELWTAPIFERMFKALKHQSVLVTYSAKGSVRRAMQQVGFLVEKLPGPPGKREMLRASKGTT